MNFNRNFPFLKFLFVFIFLITISTSSNAQSGRETFVLDGTIKKTYKLDNGGTFLLSNRNGDINIESWDKNEVEVVIVEKRRARSEDIKIVIDSKSNRLNIRTDYPNRKMSFFYSSDRTSSANFTVKVPRNVHILTDSHNGNILIRGIKGDVEAETHNGRLQIEDLEGNVDVKSHNGNLYLENINGEITSVTHNGRIELDNIESVNVYAKTHNGSISGELSIDPRGRYEFNTHNSGVKLYIPHDSKVDIDVKSRNRSFSSDFKIDGDDRDYNRSSRRSRYSRNRNTRVTGEINGGGARLKISTNNGSVSLRKR